MHEDNAKLWHRCANLVNNTAVLCPPNAGLINAPPKPELTKHKEHLNMALRRKPIS